MATMLATMVRRRATAHACKARAVVDRSGVFDAIEPAQQLRVRRAQMVVAVELEALGQSERGLDLARFGGGYGSAEPHDR
jgi:hypothetical protein